MVTDPKGMFLESFSEGMEELSQTWIENAVNDYGKWRYNNNGKYGILDAINFIPKGISDSMNDEGLKSFYLV